MATIILESVSFVVLVATGVALFAYVVLHFTPVGRRYRQASNRRRIERSAALSCPIHGMQLEQSLVRLPSGDVVCPECFKEAVHGEH